MAFQIVPLLRNGKGYLIDQYIYRKNNEKNGILNLSCRDKSKAGQKCTASAKIQEGVATVINYVHNHDAPDVDSLVFRARVMEKARDPSYSRSSIKYIYNSTRQQFLDSVPSQAARNDFLATAPSLHSLLGSIHRAKTSTMPTNPKTRSEIDGVHVAQNYIFNDNSSFLLYDSGPNDPQRFLIFGLVCMLARLSMTDQWHIDGTFWSSPGLFYQLVSIHAWIYGQIFPVFYVVLPNKTAALYKRMFQQIEQLLRNRNIELPYLSKFVCDYEQAMISAIIECFPTATHSGCFFHFSQAIYRKLSDLGFRVKYKTDANFKEAVKCLISLGHVPSAKKLTYYYSLLAQYAQDPDFMHLATTYFYPTWFTRYQLQSWDWHKVCTRTNNHLEGYHAGLKHVFKMPHLAFYNFLDILFEEVKTHSMNKFQSCVLNVALPKPTPVQQFYIDRNNRIMEMHDKIEERLPIGYLLAISRCVPKPNVFPGGNPE